MRNMEIIGLKTEEQMEGVYTTSELGSILIRTDITFSRYPNLGIGEIHLYL